MKAERFIASGMKGAKDGPLSGRTNKIAVISVAVSFAVMIVAVSVLAGFKAEISSKITGFMGGAALVMPGQSPFNETYPFSGNLSYCDKLKNVDGVTAVCPVAYRSGLLKTEDNIEGLFFKGVDSLYDFTFFNECLIEGRVPEFNGRISDEILISQRTAARLSLKVGDKVVTYFVGEPMKVRKFTVCGFYDSQLEQVDSQFALADIRQVRRLNDWEKDAVSSVEVRIAPGADIDRIEKEVLGIESAFSTESDEPLFALSVKKIYGNLFDWLALLDLNVLMILVLMIIVAGFNMISAVLIILFEKISMIGLLKSLGMTSARVGKVFFLHSSGILGKGLIWGNIAGIGLCLIQKWSHLIKLDPANYFVSFVPIDIKVWQIIVLDIAAFALIMLIVSASALFISRVSPAKTLKTD